jgi:pyruvyltransferase
MTTRLLTHYGIAHEWSPPGRCEFIGAGSILSKIPRGWRGTVWGTGFIRAGMWTDLRDARVLALRGEFTRAHVKMRAQKQPVAFGDPGILVVDLPRGPAEPVPVVLIPHYVDKLMVERWPGVPVCDITGPAEQVLGTIAAAELVVTSSLHALIAADALGVPHILEVSDKVTGGLYKFQDYASAFGDRIVPGQVRLTDRAVMAQRQEGLREALWRV